MSAHSKYPPDGSKVRFKHPAKYPGYIDYVKIMLLGMNRMPRRNQSALTIIELLVVVAIVAVLGVLIFPVVHGMSDRAKAVSCAAAMRQFATAALAYRGEHNGYLPPGYLLPPTNTTEKNNPQDGINIKKDLVDGGYLKENDLPYCPATRLTRQGISNLKKGQSERDRIREMGSYAINLFLTQTKIESLPGPYWGGYPYPGNARVVFIVEVYFCGLAYAFDSQKFTLNGADWGGLYVAPRDHGNHRLHFMFLDGHMALLGPKVKSDGSYDWSEVFDSWGRDGKYVNTRTAYGS